MYPPLTEKCRHCEEERRGNLIGKRGFNQKQVTDKFIEKIRRI